MKSLAVKGLDESSSQMVFDRSIGNYGHQVVNHQNRRYSMMKKYAGIGMIMALFAAVTMSYAGQGSGQGSGEGKGHQKGKSKGDRPNQEEILAKYDADGDGHLDILSASEDDEKIFWHENDGSATPSFAIRSIRSCTPEDDSVCSLMVVPHS